MLKSPINLYFSRFPFEKTITPILREVGKIDGYLAGGAIRRTFLSEATIKSDYDFFFKNESAFTLAKNYWLSKTDSSIIRENEQNLSILCDGKIIQLIKIAYYNTVEDLLNSFDYTICQFAIDLSESNYFIYSSPTAMFDLGGKKLVVNKITYPVASLRRLIKYTQQGFYACEGCLKELLLQSREGDLDTNIVYVD